MTRAGAEVVHRPAPLRRFLGSVLSWLVFGFSLVTLLQIVSIVAGLGGYCASGGPYVIAVECPEAVGLLTPVSVFGMFIGWGISIALSGGFGASLLAWGWTLLFVATGVQFIATGFAGSILGVLIGLFSLAMGVGPFVLWWRYGPRDLFIGTHDLHDRPFVRVKTPRRRRFRPLPWEGEPVPVTLGAVLLGAGVPLLGLAAGAAASLATVAAITLASV